MTQKVFLKTDKTPTYVISKYTNFANIFFNNLAARLPEHIETNEYTLDLIEGHQRPYRLIYNVRPIKLVILKTYIEINLANGFIRSSMSLGSTSILFVKKINESLQLYINYKDLNNLTIKNQYLLPLICISLN